MDVSMPHIDGIEATRRLVAADNRQRVVMLTMHIDRDIIDRAIKAGAVGYLTKDSTVKEVVMAMKLAANGDRSCHRGSPSRCSPRRPPPTNPSRS